MAPRGPTAVSPGIQILFLEPFPQFELSRSGDAATGDVVFSKDIGEGVIDEVLGKFSVAAVRE